MHPATFLFSVQKPPAVVIFQMLSLSVVKIQFNFENSHFFADCKSAGYAFGGSNPPSPTSTEEVAFS